MKWSTGLCGCFEDCSTCCVTTFLPCVTFGRVAEHAENEGSGPGCFAQGFLYVLFSILGVPCLYTCGYRKKLRLKYGLPDEPCGDCVVHLCCDCCALSQEAREIKIRMANTPKGWASRAMAAPHAVKGMFK
ncbi:hypothetical protein SUGI_0391380 [Cryptomeria japonica]|uniref:cell number regulator 2-like n=1 Tax=Cryptomeria japonica TaxID=3369 RepID=UPI0024089D7E|nr:cell number regulator 2-like [Cryptomeria japonica]GLJ21302.1 hypothetical protein SUGI_0391380 [Cryptomeria japonica]